MMRIAVTGRDGQIAAALRERAAAHGVEVVCLARPRIDLARPETLLPALAAARPDAIVSAAAFTQVDAAEGDAAAAFAVNASGAGAVAQAAAGLGVPLVHISTDYVFAGDAPGRRRETDETGPLGVYGASKLAGERLAAAAAPDHAILRIGWVFSPWGVNFVRTMFRLAEMRDEVGVVSDQFGGPTSALAAADGILAVAGNLARSIDPALRGLFHMPPQGEASWADLASAVFDGLAARGGRRVAVLPIATADYPTAARRPARSVLDGSRLDGIHGVALGHWRTGLDEVLDRLVPAAVAPILQEIAT